jgi:hypothetical protein
MIKFKAFDSQADYRDWLAQMGENVTVHSQVPVFERRPLWKRITNLWRGPACAITYEEVRVTLLSTRNRLCKQCGATNASADKFCCDCGVPLFTPATWLAMAAPSPTTNPE